MGVDGYVISAEDRGRAEDLSKRAKALRREAERKESEAARLEGEAFRILMGRSPGRRVSPGVRVEEMTLSRYLPMGSES